MVKITEYQFQKLVVDWLDASLPKGCFYHHSPNEGKRHVNYMVKMKNMGMKTGFPDLCLFVPTKYFWSGIPTTIFIELKRPGGKATKRQKEVHEQLREAGAIVGVIDNFAELKLFLTNLIEVKETAKSQVIEGMARQLGL